MRQLTATAVVAEVGGMKKPLPTMTNEQLRAARNELGWTQEKTAEKLGVTTSAYRKWEQGTRKVTGTAVILMGVYVRDARKTT